MDGLIREAQRGPGSGCSHTPPSPLLLSVLSRDLSAGSGKQERETRNEEGNHRGNIYSKEGHKGVDAARRNHRDPSREYARTSSTFLNFHHFRPQVQSESYQFKQYWLLNYHHMGDFTPTRAGNYSFTDPTTTQTAAD